ncbi:MAG: hypothetical protein IIA70_00955 [Proteobacteria bacterium]|nr:hypothetical protein [Pseudomonadota bacterium]
MPRIFKSPVAPDLAYFAFAGLIAVLISAIQLFDPINIYSYERDAWHHLATLNALMDSPFSATNPHVVSDDPARTFMPWFVFLALFGKAFSLNAQQVLGVSALLTMGLLVSGIYLFAREYFQKRWAPLVLFVCMIGPWGMLFNHSGLYNIETIIFSIGYPFGVVLAVGFFAWWSVLKCLDRQKLSLFHLALIFSLPAFMFSTHQLQAAFAIGAMITFALFAGQAPLARRLIISAVTVAGTLFSSLWFYYNPFTMILLGSAQSWQTNPYWYNPYFLVLMTGLAFMGFLGFYDLGRKKFRWELVVGFGAIFIGFIVGGLLGNTISHRFYPFWTLFLQMGMAAFLLSYAEFIRPPNFSGLRKFIFGTTAGLLAVLTASHLQRGFELYLFYTALGRGEVTTDLINVSPYILDSVARIKPLVGAGDVIIAHRQTAFPVQAHRMKVVSIPRPFPLVHDMAGRQQASSDFFNPEISNKRRLEIIKKYHVSHILYRLSWLEEPIYRTLGAFGPQVTFNDDLVLITIDSSAKERLTETSEVADTPGDSP